MGMVNPYMVYGLIISVYLRVTETKVRYGTRTVPYEFRNEEGLLVC